jgi:esterase/lipase superfamily enzyme
VEAPTRAPDFDAGLDAAGAREAVVFVHGYDNTFAEGLYRQVQMHHDCALPDLAINSA